MQNIDKINKFIKHREIFRPFAPAVLEERSKEYFNLKYSPFMLRVTKSNKKNIPSALHVDGTARVQTVFKELNPYKNELTPKPLTEINPGGDIAIKLATEEMK